MKIEEREVSSHETKDGNVVFSYRPVTAVSVLFDKFLILILDVLILVVWIVFRPRGIPLLFTLAFTVGLVIVLGFILAYVVYNIRDRRNDGIEEYFISNHLRDQIEIDIRNIGNNVNVIEQRYKRVERIEGSMTFENRSYVVALSDGQRLVYHVDNPQMLHEILQLEIKMQYESVPRGVDLHRVLQRIA